MLHGMYTMALQLGGSIACSTCNSVGSTFSLFKPDACDKGIKHDTFITGYHRGISLHLSGVNTDGMTPTRQPTTLPKKKGSIACAHLSLSKIHEQQESVSSLCYALPSKGCTESLQEGCLFVVDTISIDNPILYVHSALSSFEAF